MQATLSFPSEHVNVRSVNPTAAPNFADEQARHRLHERAVRWAAEDAADAPPALDPNIGAMLYDKATEARLDALMPPKVSRPGRGDGTKLVTRAELRKAVKRQSRENRSLFDRLATLEGAVADIITGNPVEVVA